MKRIIWTLLFLTLPAITKPLGSATKFWYPEKLSPNPEPHIQTPIKSIPKPTSPTQPVLKVSKFWHPKLNEQLPPKLETLEKQVRQKYPNAYLVISSGYRSKRHNARLGRRLGFVHKGGRVAKNSAHTHGKAVDLYAMYTKNGKQIVISHNTVGRMAKSIFSKTLVYNDHVHVEVK